jgi:hypothetical protein
MLHYIRYNTVHYSILKLDSIKNKDNDGRREGLVATPASAIGMTPTSGAGVPPLVILEAPPATRVSAGRLSGVTAGGVGASAPVQGERGTVASWQCSRAAIDPTGSLAAWIVTCPFDTLLEVLRRISVSSIRILQVRLDRFRNQTVGGLSRVHRVGAPQCSSARGLFV